MTKKEQHQELDRLYDEYWKTKEHETYLKIIAIREEDWKHEKN